MVKAIEKSVLGIRTAVYDLEHPVSGRKLRMLGMIHAATPEYYMEIQRELDDCDVVFYEGVRSRIVRWITLSYRIPAWFLSVTGLAYQNSRIDLSLRCDEIYGRFAHKLDANVRPSVARRKTNIWGDAEAVPCRPGGTMPLAYGFETRQAWPKDFWSAMTLVPNIAKPAKRRLIHADIDGAAFDRAWRSTAFWARLSLYLASPILGALMVFSKRFRKWAFENIGEDVELDDDDPFQAIKHLILNTRNEVMIRKIEAFWEDEPDYAGRAAGLFGAAHLPAIINHLVDRRGFRIVAARWVMAIPAD